MQQTTNYSLPTYQGTDAPNLLTGYNSAMSAIDTQMKANADAAATADGKAVAAASAASTADGKAVAAQTTANQNAQAITALDGRVDALEASSFIPKSTDPSFNVTNLAGAKVTEEGIVYIPQS